jgi:prepilin-type N-terminal cleavage/methylation domain-containing protein
MFQRELLRLRAALDRQHGLTLIEMMVALAVLAIILSAAAGSLINFGRSSVNSERRVQATSLANELHERLQAKPWDDAVVYEGDVLDLAGVDGYDPGPPATFEGEEIVSIDAGCSLADPGCRDDDIPKVLLEPADVADSDPLLAELLEDYDAVYQVVTWAERPGVSDDTIKRFTTIVQWTVLGRSVEARVQSDRAASSIDLSPIPEPTVEVTFTPSTVFLEDISAAGDPAFWVTLSDVVIDAVFPEDDALTVVDGTVIARFELADGTELEVNLTRITPRVFRGVLAEGSGPFVPDVTQPIVVDWIQGGGPGDTTSPLSFAEEPEDGGTGSPSVGAVTLAPTQVYFGRIGGSGQADRLCDDLTITVPVTGADPDGAVIGLFNADGGEARGLDPVGAIDPMGTTTFTLTLLEGSQSPWTVSTTDEFRVFAQDSTGINVDGPVISNTLTVIQAPGNGNNRPCP